MAPQGAKMEAPPQKATPRSQKGPAAEGVALQIIDELFADPSPKPSTNESPDLHAILDPQGDLETQ